MNASARHQSRWSIGCKDALKPKFPVAMAKVEAPKPMEGAIAEIEDNGAKITIKLNDGKIYKS